MARFERWLQAAVRALGSAMALVAAYWAYQVALDAARGWTQFIRSEVLYCIGYLFVSLVLLAAAALVAVVIRRKAGWRNAVAWTARAYGHGAGRGLGIAAALAVLLALYEVMSLW